MKTPLLRSSHSLFLVGLISGGIYAAPIFAPDSQPTAYIGQPEVTSHVVTSGLEVLYSIDYSVLDWSGDLHSYPITSSGLTVLVDNWTGGAAGAVDALDPSSGRKIVTMNGGTGIPFRWGSLSASQKTDLDATTAASASATTSPVLDFIRGNRSQETPNGSYRARGSALGDIIHSTPAYCSGLNCTQDTVFVGANDGMLHAFDATSGSERFAYIPSMLIPKLKDLAVNPYVHKYFVDGRMSLRKFSNKTILAGALGAGGKGLFALDVTDAGAGSEAVAASKILWEVSNATTGFANLGYTYAAPVLVPLQGGTPVVVVGNGYNNSGNGHASLFLINADTGALIAEMDTGSGTASSPNGLSSPTVVDADGNGQADLAYAGDIDGNLWKFDLVARTSTLLFTTSPAQAITMAPGITSHPNGGRMVDFVTGRMFTTADTTDTSTFYAYGIWDGAPVANTTLVTQTLSPADYTGTPASKVRTATKTNPNWNAGGNKGWRTALPVGGERVVGDGAYVSDGGQFIFLSSNPTISPTATPPGENWWMQLNALTGGDNGIVKFDLNGDTLFNSSDKLSNGEIPVGLNIGGGVRSQLIALTTTTSDVFQASYDKNGSPPVPVVPADNRGVSGGHFDFDIYCYNSSFCQVGGTVAGLPCDGTDGCSQGTTSKTYIGATTSGTTVTNSSTSSKTNIVNGSGVKPNYTHTHQYDDIFDVTGVDMLNASQPRYNLKYPVSSTSTKFKILAANQAYSPAVSVNIGGAGYVNVTAYGTPSAYASSTSGMMASLPTYVRAATATAPVKPIQTLVLEMPLDAFSSKDWGTGVVRAGLQPTSYSCVVPSNIMAAANNEWRNGALTFQIVKDTTPDSAVQLNVSGHPELGYRLKNDKTSQNYLLAEYTIFWHNPTLNSTGTAYELDSNGDTISKGQCMGSVPQNGSGPLWTMTPPMETTSHAPSATPASGSTDPKGGSFVVVGSGSTGGSTGTGGATGTGSGTSGSGGTSTGVTTGGGVNGTGGVGGTSGSGAPSGGCVGAGCLSSSATETGRVNWRELQQ